MYYNYTYIFDAIAIYKYSTVQSTTIFLRNDVFCNNQTFLCVRNTPYFQMLAA